MNMLVLMIGFGTTVRDIVKKHPRLKSMILSMLYKYKANKNKFYSFKFFVLYQLSWMKSRHVRAKKYPWAVMKLPKKIEVGGQLCGEMDVVDILSNLSVKGVCIDAGAWVGIYSLLMAKTAKRVIAIEPDKHNFYFLLQNIRLNKVKNIEPMQVALDIKNGEGTLAVSPVSTGHSIEGSTGYRYNIRTVSFESLLEQIGEDIDLVKMDIEKTEFRILRNASKTVFDRVGQWIVECHSETEKEEREMEEIFERHGYHTNWLEPSSIRNRHIYAVKNHIVRI